MDWISLILVPAIKSVVLVVILLTGFAYLSYIERKLVARFQVRYGPNRAGPFGMLQPIADALKMVFKEVILLDILIRALMWPTWPKLRLMNRPDRSVWRQKQ